MKLFPLVFAGFSALVVGALPQPAQAYPFRNSCAYMQAYLNTRTWRNPTKLEGFENQYFYTYNNNAWCNNGYITEKSPMGTRVCKGQVSYNSDGTYEWKVEDVSTNCRYK